MRFEEFKLVEQSLNEAQTLVWSEFSKKGRLDTNRKTFIDKINSNSPFPIDGGQTVIVDKTQENINAVLNWNGERNRVPKLTGQEQGKPGQMIIPVNRILKTAEFGGQAAAPGKESGKETMRGRTAHLNLHDISKEEEKAIGDIKKLVSRKGIKGSDLTSQIINNATLQSEDPHGLYIIDIAKKIAEKQYPVPIPEGVYNDEKYLKFIQDYAGEYLGIAGLVNGLGDFPKLGAFLEFLGAKSLKDLSYYFPMAENSPLADSFGFIKSPTGDHQMYMSSKGGTKGAAPSMSNLKIPNGIQVTTTQKEQALEFLKIIQTGSQIEGTFLALNYLKEIAPSSILDKQLAKLLPLTTDEIAFFNINYATDKKDRNFVVNDLPRRLRKYAQARVDAAGVKVLTGDIIMAATVAVKNAVNSGNALPDFQNLAKELLGFNFVQIFTQIKKRPPGMTFRVLWPAKIDGTVEIYSNSSQNDLKGKLGFRIH